MRPIGRAITLFAVVGALAAGCATTQDHGGLTFVEDRDLVRGCMVAGDVEASAAHYDRMLRRVVAAAKKVGATHVLSVMETSEACGPGPTCVGFRGVAYRCSNR